MVTTGRARSNPDQAASGRPATPGDKRPGPSLPCDAAPAATAFMALVLLAGLVVMPGCRSADPAAQPAVTGAAGRPSQARPQPAVEASQAIGDTLPTPPGVERRLLAAKRDEALARARQPLAAILPTEAWPPPAVHAASDPETSPPLSGDTPLAAQRAYVQGRLALSQGQAQAAIAPLRLAHGLAPQDAGILRLLAKACLNLNDVAAAQPLLEQLVAIDPADLDSLIKLGTLALRHDRSDRAITYHARALAVADQADPPSPALQRLCQYYLAASLEVAGHDLAAIGLYEAALAPRTALTDGALPRYTLSLLERQAGMIWQSIGDAHLRLGDPQAALLAYEQAIAQGVSDLPGWMARHTYTQLHLGDTQAATQRMTQFLEKSAADERAIALVEYLAQHGGDGAALAEALKPVYHQQAGRSSAMAQLIGRLLPLDASRLFLLDHLTYSPSDRAVIRQLIGQEIQRATPASPSADAAAVAQALRHTLTLMQRTAVLTDECVTILLEAVNHQGHALHDALRQLDEPSRQGTAAQYLLAVIPLGQGREYLTRPILERLVAQDDAFTPARIQLARVHMDHGRWQQAMDTLAPVSHPLWQGQVNALQVDILAGLGRSADALAKLERLLAIAPTDMDLVLRKAALLIDAAEPLQAQEWLSAQLQQHPRQEPLYAALLDLYDHPRVPDAPAKRQALVMKLLATLPQTPLAQYEHIDALIAQGSHAQAESALRQLQSRNPTHLPTLDKLVRFLRDARRQDDADAVIEAAIQASPRHPPLLAYAADALRSRPQTRSRSLAIEHQLILTQTDPIRRKMALVRWQLAMRQPDAALKTARSFINPQRLDDLPDPAMALRLLAESLQQSGKPRQAVRVMRQAITRHPSYEAELRYHLVMIHHQQGDAAAAQAELIDTLARYPDHAASNNDLAYTWAERGENLDEALRMTRLAVAAYPLNAAYLDSLGWVHYKLGRFDEAIHWLSLALRRHGRPDAVMLDHLGDAYHRAGQPAQARRHWQQAMSALRDDLPDDAHGSDAPDAPETPESPEAPDSSRQAALLAALTAKLAAMEAAGDVPVSPLGRGVVTTGSPADLPATPPSAP